MRLISALLCFCLTFNVMAASGTVQELEKALDNYQYALTVEWDQKDSAFMNAKTEAFYSTLADLMNKGLSTNDIMELAAKKTKNPKELEALKLRMELLAGKAGSASELAEIISVDAKNLYARGASWEGGAILISAGIVALFGAAIAYSIWFDKNHTCVATAQMQVCGWVSYYPEGPQYYQCWYEYGCTQYEEN